MALFEKRQGKKRVLWGYEVRGNAIWVRERNERGRERMLGKQFDSEDHVKVAVDVLVSEREKAGFFCVRSEWKLDHGWPTLGGSEGASPDELSKQLQEKFASWRPRTLAELVNRLMSSASSWKTTAHELSWEPDDGGVKVRYVRRLVKSIKKDPRLEQSENLVITFALGEPLRSRDVLLVSRQDYDESDPDAKEQISEKGLARRFLQLLAEECPFWYSEEAPSRVRVVPPKALPSSRRMKSA